MVTENFLRRTIPRKTRESVWSKKLRTWKEAANMEEELESEEED